MLDLDLAILGSSPEAYSAYVKNVKAEYTHYISEEVFDAGRAQFLRNFLMRDTLFFTPWGKDKFEKQARVNLESELAILGNGGGR